MKSSTPPSFNPIWSGEEKVSVAPTPDHRFIRRIIDGTDVQARKEKPEKRSQISLIFDGFRKQIADFFFRHRFLPRSSNKIKT